MTELWLGGTLAKCTCYEKVLFIKTINSSITLMSQASFSLQVISVPQLIQPRL